MPDIIIPRTKIFEDNLVGVHLYTREAHTREVMVSQFPVELPLGSRIDHAVVKPDRLELEGGVGNFLVPARPGPEATPAIIWDALLKASERRVPVQVLTRLRIYPRMMITGVRTEIKTGSKGGLSGTNSSGRSQNKINSNLGLVFVISLLEFLTPDADRGGLIPTSEYDVSVDNKGPVLGFVPQSGETSKVQGQTR